MKLKEGVDLKVLEELGFREFLGDYTRYNDNGYKIIIYGLSRIIREHKLISYQSNAEWLPLNVVHNKNIKDLIEKGLVE